MSVRLRLVAAALLLATATAHAQDEPQEVTSELDLFQLDQDVAEQQPVVVTASRRASPIDDAPAVMTVITGDEILAYGYTSMSEILDAAVGIVVNDAQEIDLAIVRGAGFAGQFNKRILVLIDGHPTTEVWSAGEYLEAHMIDPSAIERVEIVRGPASSLYGSNGFFAVIQVITRREATGTHGDVTVQGGWPAFGRGAGRVSGRSGEFRWMAHAYGTYGFGREMEMPELSDDVTCVPERPETCTQGHTRAEADRRIRAGAYALVGWRDFTLSARYGRYDRTLPAANYATLFNQEDNFLGVQRAYVALAWSHAFGEQTEVAARLSLDWTRYDDHLVYWEDPEAYVFDDVGLGLWGGVEARVLQTVLDSGGARDRVHFGIFGTRAVTSSESGVRGETADPIETDLLVAGGFLENDLAVGDVFRAVAGVRFDYNDTFESRVSPRGALIFHPYQNGTLKLLYSQGFRNPSPYEAFFHDETAIADNPSLRPEVIHAFDVQGTHRVSTPYAQWHFSLGAYYWTVEDLINQSTICVVSPGYRDEENFCPETNELGEQLDDRDQQQNVAGLEALGAELSVAARFRRGGHVYFNMALQSSEYSDGTTVMASPHLLSSLGMAIPVIPERLTVALETRYIGPRLSLDEALGGTQLPATLLVNAHVRLLDVIPGLSLSLTGRNLTASDTEVPMTAESAAPLTRAPGPPFSVLLGAEYRR